MTSGGRSRTGTAERGQLIRITPTGDKFLMARDLPSIVTAVNEECGPSAVAFVDDRAYLLLASGGWEIGDPAYHSGVFELQPDGALKLIWDMTAHVLEHPSKARREDPRADVPAGMAYGMAALDGKLYVTDANQEQVFEVDPASGSARLVVEYPKSNRALTGIAAGPDGALYVAEWASNKITRITVDGTITDAATKLRTPVGVTFGPDGAMYVVEFTGRVLRAAPVGEEQRDVLVEGLRAPTAIAFGPDGNLYVSVHGQNAGQGEGQIVRLRLAPPDPALERARWANAAAWGTGLIVFVGLLAVGWYFRQRQPHRSNNARLLTSERDVALRSHQPASDLDRADEDRVLLPGRGRRGPAGHGTAVRLSGRSTPIASPYSPGAELGVTRSRISSTTRSPTCQRERWRLRPPIWSSSLASTRPPAVTTRPIDRKSSWDCADSLPVQPDSQVVAGLDDVSLQGDALERDDAAEDGADQRARGGRRPGGRQRRRLDATRRRRCQRCRHDRAASGRSRPRRARGQRPPDRPAGDAVKGCSEPSERASTSQTSIHRARQPRNGESCHTPVSTRPSGRRQDSGNRVAC